MCFFFEDVLILLPKQNIIEHVILESGISRTIILAIV